MTIGERLREVRQQRNISLEDVARRTNIQLRFLLAIDEDRMESIPGSHRRLFVREYARAVGADAEAVLEDLPEYAPAIVAPEALAEPAEPVAGRRRFPEFDTAPVRRLSEKAGLSAFSSNPMMLVGAAAVLLVIASIYYLATLDETATADPAVASGTAPLSDSAAAATEILSGPVAPAETTDLGPIVLEPGDSLTLEGRATSRVWYTIVADGKRSDDGTLDSGATKTWRAAEVFKVSLGNAGGLQFFLNERPLGTLGPASAVVRSRLIDATGIRTTPRPATPQSSAPPAAASVPAAGAPATATGRATSPRSTVTSTTAGTSRPRAPRRRTPRRTNTAAREISPTDLR